MTPSLALISTLALDQTHVHLCVAAGTKTKVPGKVPLAETPTQAWIVQPLGWSPLILRNGIPFSGEASGEYTPRWPESLRIRMVLLKTCMLRVNPPFLTHPNSICVECTFHSTSHYIYTLSLKMVDGNTSSTITLYNDITMWGYYHSHPLSTISI